jgi:hypothetical protein
MTSFNPFSVFVHVCFWLSKRERDRDRSKERDKEKSEIEEGRKRESYKERG